MPMSRAVLPLLPVLAATLAGLAHAATPAQAGNAGLEDCKRYGAKPDAANPATMILPIPASYPGPRPARPVTYARKVPVTIANWQLSYCDDDGETLSLVYEPAPTAPPIYATCAANVILFPSNRRMEEAISGGEATLRTSGLSGTVRSRTQLGSVSGQPATYYRVTGIRVFQGTPAQQQSSVTFGTARTGSGSDGSAPEIEPVAWTFTLGTNAAQGSSCLPVHLAVTDLARQFPLGAAEKAWTDPQPPRALSSIVLPGGGRN